MNERININDLNDNRIKQAIDNLTRFHIDKMEVFTVNLDDDLDIVLQLIEKQQAEIKTLKRDFEIVDHECSRLEQEDIKKDKIINEMIGYICTRGWIVCPNEECGANLDCENRCRSDDSIYEECWRMYFERKIEQ